MNLRVASDAFTWLGKKFVLPWIFLEHLHVIYGTRMYTNSGKKKSGRVVITFYTSWVEHRTPAGLFSCTWSNLVCWCLLVESAPSCCEQFNEETRGPSPALWSRSPTRAGATLTLLKAKVWCAIPGPIRRVHGIDLIQLLTNVYLYFFRYCVC